MELFCEYSINDLVKKIAQKQMSVQELMNETINKSQIYKKFKMWNDFDETILKKDADKVQQDILNGRVGKLSGIPVAVKDIFNTYDYTTEMGSKLWKGFQAGNDARVVADIKYEGGIVAGKSVTAEFAVHELNETLNPYDITKTPGTSSSGSAVAVALGTVPVALATQTAGSIMRPSSFCGVYGYKPSFGVVPRTGILKTTDSLDTVGFITSNVDNIRTMFNEMAVKGPDYPFSYAAYKDKERQTKTNRPWKIAFIKTYTWKNADRVVKDSIEEWVKLLEQSKDIVIEEIDIDNIICSAHDIHRIIYDKSLAYYFKNEYKDKENISEIMKKMMEQGEKVSNNDFWNALNQQEEMSAKMDCFMKNYDAIISLSTASDAVLRHEMEKDDPSLIWTLLGLPAINIPKFINKETEMPFGVQLAGRKYNDYLLITLIEYLAEIGLIPRNITENRYKEFDIK